MKGLVAADWPEDLQPLIDTIDWGWVKCPEPERAGRYTGTLSVTWKDGIEKLSVRAVAKGGDQKTAMSKCMFWLEDKRRRTFGPKIQEDSL